MQNPSLPILNRSAPTRVWLTWISDDDDRFLGARDGYLDHLLLEEPLTELCAVLVGRVDDDDSRSNILVVTVADDAWVAVSTMRRQAEGNEPFVDSCQIFLDDLIPLLQCLGEGTHDHHFLRRLAAVNSVQIVIDLGVEVRSSLEHHFPFGDRRRASRTLHLEVLEPIS